MFRRNYSLCLLALWLAIAFCLLAPESLVPAEFRRHLGGPFRLPVGVMAIAFAFYNLARWWWFRSLDRNRVVQARNPLFVRTLDSQPESSGPNPELDFLKLPDPPPLPEEGDQHQK